MKDFKPSSDFSAMNFTPGTVMFPRVCEANPAFAHYDVVFAHDVTLNIRSSTFIFIKLLISFFRMISIGLSSITYSLMLNIWTVPPSVVTSMYSRVYEKLISLMCRFMNPL